MVSYLASIGINPVRVVGDFHYYLSPLRDENHPSFRIERSRNKWTDFGIELKRKSFLDFIMAYRNIDIKEAVRQLNNQEIRPAAYIRSADLRLEPMPEPLKVKVFKDSMLQSAALLCYLQLRNIDLEIASHYCREVNFNIKGKNYYGIGFRNDSGRFEIRSPYMKAAENKQITTINNCATMVRVFEGFFDFLTFMTLHKNNPPHSNYVILHCAHLMRRKETQDFLALHDKVFLFLDNDPTGEKYTHEAISADGKRYEDRRFQYATHADLNEWAVDKAADVLRKKKWSQDNR
ncbi:toprim domain-containing protein [Mucilaginibacter sp. AK015]|uniref:toprim domain-containing protein n=1 Tax=Mucilaginibacter sp. AK015 TaxID=2723072 RepID=UPI00161514F1|nr:toprim domain-containing protein [Mucilaginibacter sp. AK015]MBB5396685.1 DNA primase [Mucilaginibacter sp. AK015]